MKRHLVLALAVVCLMALTLPAAATAPVSRANGALEVAFATGASGCAGGPWGFHAQAKEAPDGSMTARFWWTEGPGATTYTFELIEDFDDGLFTYPTVSFFDVGSYSQAYFFVAYEDLAGTTLDDSLRCLSQTLSSDFPDGPITTGHPLTIVLNDYGLPGGGQDEIWVGVTTPDNPGGAWHWQDIPTSGNVTVKVAG